MKRRILCEGCFGIVVCEATRRKRCPTCASEYNLARNQERFSDPVYRAEFNRKQREEYILPEELRNKRILCMDCLEIVKCRDNYEVGVRKRCPTCALENKRTTNLEFMRKKYEDPESRRKLLDRVRDLRKEKLSNPILKDKILKEQREMNRTRRDTPEKWEHLKSQMYESRRRLMDDPVYREEFNRKRRERYAGNVEVRWKTSERNRKVRENRNQLQRKQEALLILESIKSPDNLLKNEYTPRHRYEGRRQRMADPSYRAEFNRKRREHYSDPEVWRKTQERNKRYYERKKLRLTALSAPQTIPEGNK